MKSTKKRVLALGFVATLAFSAVALATGNGTDCYVCFNTPFGEFCFERPCQDDE